MSKKPTYEELAARVRELEENEAKRILAKENLGEKAKNVCLETGQNPIGDQLKWSQYMLQTILDAIPSPVFWKNSDLRYLGGNRAFLESAGIDSDEDIVGKNDYDLPWQPEQADTFRIDDKEVMESGIPKYNIVETYPRPNGAHGWVRTNKVPLIDGAGDVVGILGTAEEITDLKQQEEKLKQTAQRLAQAHRIGKIGFLEWSIKTDRMYWSDEIYHLYGIDPQVIPTIDHLWHLVHPEDLEYVKKNYELAVCSEKEYNIDHRIVRDDNGNVIWIHAQAKVEIDDNGDLECISATVIDITKRKEVEEELLKSQKRLVEAERIGQIGNWSYEVATGKIEWSPGMYLIYGRDPQTDTVSYESLIGFIHPADRDEHDKYFERMLALKPCDKLENLEYRLIRPDGEERWVDVCFECEFNDKCKPVFFFGTIIDITARKKAQTERHVLQTKLMQSQKMESIGNLAGGIAHDFNNILASIIGFTELALDETPKGTIAEESLQEVYSAGKRAKDLVQQILAFSRQSDEKKNPLKPSKIAKEVLNLIRSTIPTTIEIQQNLDSGSWIMGNATQIHQVFMNLCTNAANAMEDSGGVLTVSTKDLFLDTVDSPKDMKAGDYVEIKVTDTGTGITPEIYASIFEPYFTTKKPGEGSGMGLSVVHGIVESYGGRISFASQLGKGTTFTIFLPISKKRSDHKAYVPEQLPTGTECILFVDDEHPIAKIGSRTLESLGYSVTTRTSSVEAFKLFRAKPKDFDLVITDMTMPNMTGDQLAIELMKVRNDIPVILCTGYSKKLSVGRATEIGIKAFAYKPIVKADLAQTVRKVLDDGKSES